jgi:hypothetical protein
MNMLSAKEFFIQYEQEHGTIENADEAWVEWIERYMKEEDDDTTRDV